ncbi:hypothetical protein [Kangiella shandongensis]|uniref:hypothetical protein n=1 Tax=Kangiella shandongensis TaxID=2763258 RepID=UPI001CBC7696|nr:hypothetical protein [Kangiella shandongensis]
MSRNIGAIQEEYYKKIAESIKRPFNSRKEGNYYDRYYVKKTKPFFVGNEVFYEVTFTTAIDSVSKFDRVIAFTKLDILPNYAVKLLVSNDRIEVFGKYMPIHIIDKWEVNIRPCELNRFADIFGEHAKISYSQNESKNLMSLLTRSGLNLSEVVELTENYYQRFKQSCLNEAKSINFFESPRYS